MSYILLGQSLHDTADRAKKYFTQHYGAGHFVCEQDINPNLPLRPTWQGTTNAGYKICIDVRESPFSNTLYQFVSECATRGLPIRLWVAVPKSAAGPSFNSELKQAHDQGIGVVQIAEDGSGHEFHRPVPLSLFALKKTDLSGVPKSRREEIKTCESTFLDGTPDLGCQGIYQILEQMTRRFAEFTYNQGMWRQQKGASVLNPSFFQKDAWASVLEQMESRLDIGKVRHKSPAFAKQDIVRTRGHTDWRNSVSHKPKTAKQLQERDAKLRTMFESARDLLLDWYKVCKPLKLT